MSVGSKLYDVTKRFMTARKLACAVETTLFGSSARRNIAAFILDQHHKSEFRRKWLWWCYGEPHFEDHSDTLWHAYRGNLDQGIYRLGPAFNAARVIKQGDSVLDILAAAMAD